MIAVVADDLTGAAELGGIGLRYNLNVEVALEVNSSTKADLLIVATDTRSGSEQDAIAEMTKVSQAVADLSPDLIFKKVDSVLRGHVLAELNAQLDTLEQNTALLVPANPALGRAIKNGTYYVYDKPIAETGFKDDPEFPVKSSSVVEMLKAEPSSVQVANHQEIFEKRIVVGEASDTDDLRNWAERSSEHILNAGAAGFFSALLEQRGVKKTDGAAAERPFGGNKLYVCGTAFVNSAIRVEALLDTGLVRYIPESFLNPDNPPQEEIESWTDELAGLISKKGAAILAVDNKLRENKPVSAKQLRERTALVVRAILEKLKLKELIIEGGSTASAIFRAVGIKTLFPSREYAPGVIRSRAAGFEDLYITLKPGSYNWPGEVWMF